VLGYTRFCDLTIRLNSNVLIPRPETEEMIYMIRDKLSFSPHRILDIGTGSGCIALVMKKLFPEAETVGLDVNRAALEVATVNGRENNLRVQWKEGNILDRSECDHSMPYDLIISNPPYVLESERQEMEPNVLDFEPAEALFVRDQDPLLYYRAISEFSRVFLEEDGVLWVEINERLGEKTSVVFRKGGFEAVTIHEDIHGKERFIEARRQVP
jgi:release factor glutamine methyltransferase